LKAVIINKQLLRY